MPLQWPTPLISSTDWHLPLLFEGRPPYSSLLILMGQLFLYLGFGCLRGGEGPARMAWWGEGIESAAYHRT